MDQARNPGQARKQKQDVATVYDLKPFMKLNNYTTFEEFNTILHEASIPRDVHILKVL